MSIQEFLDELEKLSIKLNQDQLDKLNKYYELLIEYNKVMNLTGITEKKDVYLKHFYDSLAITKVISLNNQSLCDIGTGAGFPGLVLKIVFPNLKITLVDSLQKRVNFLNVVIKELGLKDIEAVHDRIEEYALKHRSSFDITTSRAVAHTSILLEYAIPLTKVNGYFIPLKANIDDELKESEHAINELNAKLIKMEVFKLPIENSTRTILVFEKTKENLHYPRKYSEIKKQRL